MLQPTIGDPMTEADQEEKIREAWRILGEAITKGEVTLQEKVAPMVLTTKEVIEVAKYLAAKRPPRITKVPVMDSLLLKSTESV